MLVHLLWWTSARINHKTNHFAAQIGIDVIQCFGKEKLTVRDLANRFKMNKYLAANIVEDQRELLEIWQKNGDMKRITHQSKSHRIDEVFFKWFSRVRAKKLPISVTMIQKKASEIAVKLEVNDIRRQI